MDFHRSKSDLDFDQSTDIFLDKFLIVQQYKVQGIFCPIGSWKTIQWQHCSVCASPCTSMTISERQTEGTIFLSGYDIKNREFRTSDLFSVFFTIFFVRIALKIRYDMWDVQTCRTPLVCVSLGKNRRLQASYDALHSIILNTTVTRRCWIDIWAQ